MSYQFACRDNDHQCRWKGHAPTEEQLMDKIAEHARKKHGVQNTTATLANFLRKGIKQS